MTSYFRIRKVGEGGVRMFQSVTRPNCYIQIKDGKCNGMVRAHEFNFDNHNCFQAKIPILIAIKLHSQPIYLSSRDSHGTYRFSVSETYGI